jgi:hypothetical protein
MKPASFISRKLYRSIDRESGRCSRLKEGTGKMRVRFCIWIVERGRKVR